MVLIFCRKRLRSYSFHRRLGQLVLSYTPKSTSFTIHWLYQGKCITAMHISLLWSSVMLTHHHQYIVYKQGMPLITEIMSRSYSIFMTSRYLPLALVGSSNYISSWDWGHILITWLRQTPFGRRVPRVTWFCQAACWAGFLLMPKRRNHKLQKEINQYMSIICVAPQDTALNFSVNLFQIAKRSSHWIYNHHQWICYRQRWLYCLFQSWTHMPYVQGMILGLHPANERRRYKVTASLIGWAHT